MEPSDLLQLQMEVEALKQQVCQTLDTILARIEQHLPLHENESRYQRLKNYDWSKLDQTEFGNPKKKGVR